MAKIKLDSHLYDRAKKVAGIAGYSGVDEFWQMKVILSGGVYILQTE